MLREKKYVHDRNFDIEQKLYQLADKTFQCGTNSSVDFWRG